MDELQAARNCRGDSPLAAGLHFAFDPHLRRCPRAAIPALAVDWVALYGRWRSLGELPFPGGWEAQPCYVGQAFEVIDAAMAKVRMENIEDLKRRHRHPPGAEGPPDDGV